MRVDAFDLVTRRLAEVTGYQPPRPEGGWRCPAHGANGGDRNPSLSVNRGREGALVHCQRDCTIDDVLAALGLTRKDLFDQDDTEDRMAPDRFNIDRTYDYTDEAGTLLFQVVRTIPKGFVQRVPDGKGDWIWKIGETRKVIYRLPQIIAAVKARKRVWIVEGEKDVEALERAGEVATCNPAGAGKWKPEYTPFFKGARVTIVRDRDDVGRRHAGDVALELQMVARTVRIVDPINGKDAADHLGAGFGVDDFVGDPEPRPALEFVTAAEHAYHVDNMPPVGWLIKPIWPADSHGIIAAEQKAGKTWSALDLAVCVASGKPWLGMFDCDTVGPVIMCLGEGGERKMLRRLRAICEFHGVRYEDLEIHTTFRVPHLTNSEHLAELQEKVGDVQPKLVIIDPLYLAARGAKSSQLIEMGEHLESVQQITQQVGSALAIIHHWNKTGTGSGASRMTGVGGQEWGRVLLSAGVIAKNTDEVTKESRVTLEFDLMGDEVPEMTFRVRRRVWSDDPDDLNAPMHYVLEEIHAESDNSGDKKMSPSMRRIHAVLLAATDWLSVREIGDRVAEDSETGTGLKKRTIQDGLQSLAELDLVVSHGQDSQGQAYSWRALDALDQSGRKVRESARQQEEYDDDPAF